MIISISGYSGSGKDTIGKIIQYLTCNNTGDVTIEEINNYYVEHGWWLEEQSGWEIKKWASKLKQIASILTGIPADKFEDQEFKKTYLPKEWDYWTVSVLDNDKLKAEEGRFSTKQEAEEYSIFLQQAYGMFRMEYVIGYRQMTVRQFLQELGTDACRENIHPNVWVNALMSEYKPYGLGMNHEGVSNWIITDTRFPNEAEAIKKKGGILIRVDRPGVGPLNDHPSEIALDDYPFDYKIANVSDLEALALTVKTILKETLIL